MRYFITGTDTDVGKTVVTACLAQAAAERGSVRAVKPIATGTPTGQVPADAQLISTAAGHAPAWFFSWEPPVSPHRAAIDSGSRFDPVKLKAWIRDQQAATVLVEGVGGWRVPILTQPDGVWVSDLARSTEGTVIVVAADRVGVLNHTQLTVEAILADGLSIAGVVLNRAAHTPDPSTASNIHDLRALLHVPVVHMGHLNANDSQERLTAGRALWRMMQ